MFLTRVALITLDLEGVAFNRAAYAASLLELFAEGFETFGALGDTCYDRDGLSSSSFGLPPDTHDTITRCARSGIAADTFDQLAQTLGA